MAAWSSTSRGEWWGWGQVLNAQFFHGLTPQVDRSIGGQTVKKASIQDLTPPAFFKLVQRIREEVECMPDFRMTLREAAQFWALDVATCLKVLSELSRAGVVARDNGDRYLSVATNL